MKVILLNTGDHDDAFELTNELELVDAEDNPEQYIFEIDDAVWEQYLDYQDTTTWWDMCLYKLRRLYPAVGD